ncbi:MAG: 2-nitropropane dioxygenase [Planctomycetes bacterium GWF2_41_51]|nr:MAG: 2-nitropropane dioxygenase [Planctomycetes bacterium GWF2_41_51]HBG26775.1 nitronate monooxygenase [Phycisphaerales bacterium]
MTNIPPLKIGNLEINPPIIQGGMGIRVSGAKLASAVANTGCAGVIASTGIGMFEELRGDDLWAFNGESLRGEIRKARSLSKGIIGVNIMVALTDYENLVKVSVEENVDMIICGAGLPLELPKFLNGKDIKLIPIVSSAKALALIIKRWKGRYDKMPDAVIVEGIHAGGHLGYSAESLEDGTAMGLEEIVKEVVELSNSFENKIPVIAAGGIFDGEDIARLLKLGASGVQMATRFVCTDECDVNIKFKQAYINAGPDDITIIKSPVGLPGRVITNNFVKKIKQGLTVPFKCVYKCLRTCDPGKAPYCIAKVLSNASMGNLDESFVFAGSNAYKCKEIVSVKKLVEQLTEELKTALAATQAVVANPA